MSLFPFTAFLIAVDEANVAHAVGFGMEKKDLQAACGALVQLYGVRTCVKRDEEWVEEVMAMAWPPRVSRWKDVMGEGSERCKVCFEATGKPKLAVGFDEVEKADDVFGPCDQLRGEKKRGRQAETSREEHLAST